MKTPPKSRKPRKGSSLRRMVRELPEDATCADCGNTAANSGCSRSLEEIDATDRNFIEHWSSWKDGKHFVLGSEPEETFPLDAKGKKWEVCGDCGCPRWNLPNDEASNGTPKT